MKTQNRFFNRLSLLILILFLASCSKDDPGAAPGPEGCTSDCTIADVLANANAFEDFPEQQTVEESNEEPPYNDNYSKSDDDVTERFICTKRTVSITDGSADFFLFNPNSSVIYPGNLLQGRTLDDATPESIPLKRGGGVISYNIIDGNLASSQPVDEISLSSVRDAQNQIIAGSIADGDPSVPANFSLTIEQVQSKEELALKLGVKFKTFAAKISGNLEVNTNSKVHNVIVKLTQRYYTMDVDVPTSPEDFFHESVTAERLAEYIQSDNPAAYISSVTYGRIFYMLFESSSSEAEMKSKLEAGYKTIGTSTAGSVEYESFNSLENLNLQVIAYGGKSSETLEAVGNFTDNESIGDFLAKIGQSSDITTGLPLSYVVNSVARPSQIVGAKLATEFDLVTCELKGILPPASYLSLVDLFEDGIGAAAQIEGANTVFYNKAGTKYAWYNLDLGKVLGVFDIKDPNGPLGASTFDSVGAAVNIADGKIHIYDETGLLGEIFSYKACNCNGTDIPTVVPIGTYNTNSEGDNIIYPVNSMFGDSPFPFAGEGFMAASRYITNRFSDGANIVHFFGKPGNEYAGYYGDGTWADKNDANNWGDGTQTHFESIGAACRILIGTSNIRQLFFNEDGTKFTIWNPDAPNLENEFSAPWVIN